MSTKTLLSFLFVLHIIFWLIIIRYFFNTISQTPEKVIFFAALFGKILAGCSLGWLYLYYYQGGDTLGYEHDARILSDIFKEDANTYLKAILGFIELETLQYHAQSRALFFAKIASLISIFSLQNYWVISIVLSMVSFFASWWWVMQLRTHFDFSAYVFFIPFLFYPSVVFWSSGLLKESLALALIYILCGLFLQVYFQAMSKKKWIGMLSISILCAWMLWLLKYYYAALLLPLLSITLLYRLLKRHTNLLSSLWRSMLFILPAFSIIILFMYLHPNLQPDLILRAIVRNHDLSVAASAPGGYMHYESLTPTLSSFLFYFPKAVFGGLFRPLPGEGATFLHLVSGIENLMVAGLSAFAFYLIFTKKVRYRISPLLIICMLYVVLMAGLIALASPNFGSLVRYKVAYAPFWVFLCLLVIHLSQRSTQTSQSIKKM